MADQNARRMSKGKQAKGENDGKLIEDVMEMLKNISSCLASFTKSFENLKKILKTYLRKPRT